MHSHWASYTSSSANKTKKSGSLHTLALSQSRGGGGGGVMVDSRYTAMVWGGGERPGPDGLYGQTRVSERSGENEKTILV